MNIIVISLLYRYLSDYNYSSLFKLDFFGFLMNKDIIVNEDIRNNNITNSSKQGYTNYMNSIVNKIWKLALSVNILFNFLVILLIAHPQVIQIKIKN